MFDSLYTKVMRNKITETTLADGNTIQYDKCEVVQHEAHINGETIVQETKIYYLHGKEVGKLQPNGDLFVNDTNTLYLYDGNYVKLKDVGNYIYSYDDSNNLYLERFDGIKYNSDGTYEVGCYSIANIYSNISRRVYNLDDTISCYDADGELLGIYDKNGNVINDGESYYKLKSINDYENAEFDYENGVFKINESIDGKCDYYTVGGDNEYTFYNNDGSYYTIGYYHYGGSNYVGHTYTGYFSDEDMNSMSMYTNQGINFKSTTNYDANGNKVSSIMHDVRNREIVYTNEF